ncbi:MAG TPA: folylpolyglutamate synthase/dihydrofolate synthase family protein [Myxococcota bacterium]|nr:folylpolyglutamate synthase/dihydrofolate synthase family protein [Myxococcota bacterium]
MSPPDKHPGSSVSPLERAAAWLEGLINVERLPELPYSRLSLDPICQLLARVGEPQRDLCVIHVAGSKGKGSTALFAEAILRAGGERVGTFTSPHLERWTERFRICGEEVSGDALASALEWLRPHAEALTKEAPGKAPTFFDVITAAAFLLFRDAAVDCAVVEVGMGGRLDSTNVVDPAVACITTIELEHTDRLGTTLAAIAGEKAGILKRGRPAVIGALPAEALAVVEARAQELGAPLSRLCRELSSKVTSSDDSGVGVCLRDGSLEVEAKLSTLGVHQAANAALALAGVRRATPHWARETLAEAARAGLAAARLPGRVELLGRRPFLVVDGAHTAESARALASALGTLARRRSRLVLSVSSGKNLAGILAAVLPCFDEIFVTRADSLRSLDPAQVAAAIRAADSRAAVHAVPNPFMALRGAREGLGEEDLLCATGSLYLAGIARKVLAAER